ncbi:MAG: DUF2490 domain-containing protein [Bacteroidota bacterium]
MNSEDRFYGSLPMGIVFMFLSAFQGISQTRIFYSLFPGLSISAPVADNLEFNLSTFLQYNTIGTEYEGISFPAAVNYFDVQFGGVYKFNQHVNFASAWYYRSTDPGRISASSEIRFWQQVSFISRINNLKFRNRLRIEQRLISRNDKTDPLRWRLRYQTGFEIPLQGEKTDIREFYLTLTNEAYFNLNKPRSSLYGENWISALTGYRISEKFRLEAGPAWQTQIRNTEGEKNSFFHFQANFVFQAN